MLWYSILCVAHRTTYYTDHEEARLEALAEQNGESFSGIVREAIHEYYGINNE